MDFGSAVQAHYRDKHTQLVIDVVPGRGGGFSLEAPEGVRFLSRGRVFTDDEKASLAAAAVITGADYERGERPAARASGGGSTRPSASMPGTGNRSTVEKVIPLPRPWLLASAMLIGSAVGLLAGVACTVVIHASIRPGIAIASVVGIPSVVGLTTILFSGRRWVTMLGAFMLSLAPGWFGVLVALQVTAGG